MPTTEFDFSDWLAKRASAAALHDMVVTDKANRIVTPYAKADELNHLPGYAEFWRVAQAEGYTITFEKSRTGDTLDIVLNR